MLLSQSQSICELSFSICGDVTVHASAAIASGTVLQANLGARLTIEAGVSIGMGCIVHVYEGNLTIATGACLGSGVLIVGSGKIGANACIGSMTTIINGCVEAGQVIPPESLIGDGSRQVSRVEADQLGTSTLNGATVTESAIPESTVSESAIPVSETVAEEPERSQPEPPTQSLEPPEPPQSPDTQMPKVVGLKAFNGLMTSLFPYRQLLNQPLNQPTSELDQTPHTPEG